MGVLWPPGWTRIRRGALLIVNGLALWLTALLIHVFQNPAAWNIARSRPPAIAAIAVATTTGWATRLTATPSSLVAYLGGVLVVVGVGWYWLLRPVVVRQTGLFEPILDAESADQAESVSTQNHDSR